MKEATNGKDELYIKKKIIYAITHTSWYMKTESSSSILCFYLRAKGKSEDWNSKCWQERDTLLFIEKKNPSFIYKI